MSMNNLKMNRRTMLRAAGISLALPWMESLASPLVQSPPRRFCSIYFPYGVSLPNPARPDIRVAHVNTSAAHIQQSVENSLKNLINPLF